MDKKGILLEEYKLATRDFNHESTLLWQKTYFFITASGLLFSYSASKFVLEVLFLRVILAILGLLVSLIWLFIARRAGEYISYREKRVLEIEEKLKEPRLYHIQKQSEADVKGRIRKLLRVRPLVTTILPSIFIVLWLAMLTYVVTKN